MPPFLPPPPVRAMLAHVALGIPDEPPPHRIGAITLHPHQRVAVARLQAALDAAGGALLADDVGMGKTYVALALARLHAPAAVVAPAALRDAWAAAMRAADASCPLVAVEALSRATLASHARCALAGARLVVVDEAHHLRNPATRRWRRLAALAAHARVLLLSATPVHNAPRELAAELALFLGSSAARLDAPALARLIVRRRRPVPDPSAGAHLPSIAPTRWHRPAATAVDRALCDAVLALPPPLPPRDGGHAAALGRLTLLRLLASGEETLRAGLRRRLARAAALDAALADGRHLDARELRAWCAAGTDVQLGLALHDGRGDATLAAARQALGAHVDGLRGLLVLLDDPALRARCDARVAWLRALRVSRPGQRLVAFTQFADTARALYARLASDGRVALLTASGGRIASGPLGRRELLARFAPLAAGLPPPPSREDVTLLLATDCLSEGLDLRDAAVVVHLDVPWTPARLAQRAGRAARLGAPHARVVVHGLAPPTAVARALRVAERLRGKARAAARLSGSPDVPPLGDAPAVHVRVAERLERWLGGAVGLAHDEDPPLVVSAVLAPFAGFLAACRLDDEPVLLVGRGNRVSARGSAVLRAVRLADRAAPASAPPPSHVAVALRLVRRWLRRRAVARAVGVGASAALVARLDAAVAGLPPHRRAARAVDLARLRGALAAPLPAGVEAALASLASDRRGEAWLDAALAALPAPRRRRGESCRGAAPYGPPAGGGLAGPSAVRALLLFVPGAPAGRSNHSSPRPV